MGTPALANDRRRILIVDDVELNRTLTEAVLRGAAYEVDCANDSASALAAIETKRYDLVLLDLEMPGGDGHAAAAAIRRRNLGQVRLAVLSARNGTVDRRRSAEVGMDAHIARPIAPTALLREVERVFRTADLSGEPWQRQLFDEWVARLGVGPMEEFLVRLREELRTLLTMTFEENAEGEPLRRLAHDVASTGGMLGFLDVTRCCRALLEALETLDAIDAVAELRVALRRAIGCLDEYLVVVEQRASQAA